MNEIFILQVLILTFSSLSIFSGIPLFYFIKKMPQALSYRQRLAVVLIAVEIGKAIAMLIYPANAIATNDISTAVVLVSGFLTHFFIEAGDIGVLIMAIHTAILIFKPRTDGNYFQAGLYTHRKIVYALWVFIPLLLSSLAFVNPAGPTNAYVAFSFWCWLPRSPIVYRLCLSWIPRYLILAFIVVTYVCIVIHVIRSFHKNDKLLEATYEISTDRRESSPRQLRLLYIELQLTYLFIYPVVYFILSIPQLVFHVVVYKGGNLLSDFAIGVTVAVIIPSFATVFCIIYLLQEKPWRQEIIVKDTKHARNNSGTSEMTWWDRVDAEIEMIPASEDEVRFS